MINRILLRIKVIQIIFAYFKSDEKGCEVAERELFHSVEKSYDLYFYLLLLAVEITHYAQNKIETGLNKFRPTEEELHPNTRFADNQFIAQLEQNETFIKHIRQKNLSWVENRQVVKALFDTITSTSYYAEYMSAQKADYEADKDVWKKIFKYTVLTNEFLEMTLEEQDIYWSAEMDFVISFIIKTIKRFSLSDKNNVLLMPMYNHDDDKDFARQLLHNTIIHVKENQALIDEFTKNWELDRIAYMDVVVMLVALAEINDFPSIPINVTLNEYIEIAKQYSTEKSGTFVNGVLDKIVAHLRQEGKLVKVS